MYKIKLSPYSKFLYNEWLLYPESPRYNMNIAQKLYGNLDIARLALAINRYFKDHLLLNSHIDNGLYWVENHHIEGLEYSENYTEDIIKEYINRPFDLDKGPLCRFKLLKVETDVHVLAFVLHHVIIDGLSVDVGIVDSLSNYYNDESYSIKFSIDEQISLINSLSENLCSYIENSQQSSREFWESKLHNIESINLNFLKLTTDVIKNSNSEVKQIEFDFAEKEIQKLNQLKRKYLVTPYIYSQCVMAMLLYRYTGHTKFAICYPLAIKGGADIIYGSQVNTSLITYEFNENTKFIDLIEQARLFFKSLKEGGINHSYYPTHNLVEIGGKSLLNVFFNQGNFTRKPYKFTGIDYVEAQDYFFNKDKIDFLLFKQELRDNLLTFRINYSEDYFDSELLKNFVNTYKRFFIEILDDLLAGCADKQVSNYNLLNHQEYKQIVYDWNNTSVEYEGEHKTIHELFEDSVKINPDSIAIVYKDIKLTYFELNQKSNQLARYLRETYRVKPNDLIALFLDRSENILVAIIAALKSNAAYVPISPDYPVTQINYILENAQIKLILVDKANQEALNNILFTSKQEQIFTPSVVTIDETEIMSKLCNISIKNLDIESKSDDLAYVIYTSGTTGNPKGVMVEHRNALNTILSLNTTYDFQYGNRVLAFTSYMFDVSVSEFFVTLFNGGELHIISDTIRNNEKEISIYLNQNHINYVYLPPVLLAMLPRINYPDLIGIIYAGECCEKETGSYWSSSKYKLYNYYGPTETAIYAAGKQVINGDVQLIGKPLANTQLYVMDKNLSVLPIGAIGELFIGGAGVSRGYLNNQALTNEKFIINPIQNPENSTGHTFSKLYKTGDLVRLMPDGNIEYIGRIDNQIKLRGYRIELDAIRSQIVKYSGIKQAWVMVREHDSLENIKNNYIVAYYTAERKLDESAILGYLEDVLPKYMLPNAILFLDKVPVSTSSSKLDRNALPDPTFISEEIFIAPTNTLEKQICDIFAKVLALPENSISINHDFFKLGGNSILAISLTHQLNINFEISIAKVLELKTPAKISQVILNKKTELSQKIKQIKKIYQKVTYFKDVDIINYTDEIYKKQMQYIDEVEKIVLNNNLKKLQNILVTGCTGHLGCHILNKLLLETDYKLYVLVRASSDEHAYSRLSKKYYYYFDKDLTDYGNRLVVMNANIEYQDLKLDSDRFQMLVNNIDSIIHCAALVKHYGNYDDFYLSNVQPTINLLELAKLCRNKDFHYVSTVATVLDCYIPDQEYHIFNEDDDLGLLARKGNVYAQTKFEAEKIICDYRKYGLNTNIYRVGNLVMNSTTYKPQENHEDNLFYSHFKVMLDSGVIPSEILEIEISPVDYTALGIVKLFDKVFSINKIYHVFNPNACNLFELLKTYKTLSVKKSSLDEFINYTLNKLNTLNSNNVTNPELFLLYRFWQNEIGDSEQTQIKITQDKTNKTLNQLDFFWPKVTSEMLSALVKQIIL